LYRSNWDISVPKNGLGFESCAILPVVEALLFAPIVNVCLVDLVAFDLVFVAMVGGDGGGKVHSDKEFTGELRKSTETLTRIKIYI
jgi:hypothetical protein